MWTWVLIVPGYGTKNTQQEGKKLCSYLHHRW
jgi:hypothetical protein